MPFTTTFALVLTAALVTLGVLALPVRASAEATETGSPWNQRAQLAIGFFGAVAVGAAAAGFLGMVLFALIESM